MSKFKVGDIVKGNKHADHLYLYTTSEVTEARVMNVYGDRIGIKALNHQFDTCLPDVVFDVESRAFDLVRRAEPSPEDWKVVIKPTSDTTTVGKLYCGGKLVKEVCTEKHPDDEYNRDEAIRVICDRLVGEKKEAQKEEPPKPYNGKVVCVDNHDQLPYYTVGKIYRVEDGIITVNRGVTFPVCDRYMTFDDLCNGTSAAWIEVVEE